MAKSRPILDSGTPPQTRQRLARRVAFISAVLVVGIFGSYEVVERLWLHNVDVKLLHVLHLVRGITCSAIVGVVATVLLLRRFPSVFLATPIQAQAGLVIVSEDRTLCQSTQWFIAARWWVAVIIFVAMLLDVHVLRVLPSGTFLPLLATVAVLAFANVIFSSLQSRIIRYDRFLVYQIMTDLLFLTAVLHFSGGIENPFSRVYIFHIVIAAILLSARVAYGLTVVASLFLAGMAVGESSGMLAHYPIALFPYPHGVSGTVYPASYLPFVIGKISACILVFWVTAFFCTFLAAQLRLREGALWKSADAIRASEQRLQVVIDSMGAALLLWSKDLCLEWCNQTAREWFHLGKGDILERCPCASDSISLVDRGSDCAVVMAIHKGATTTVERWYKPIDKTSRTLRIQAIPLNDDHGRVVQILEMAQDVTEEKAIEAQMLESTKMAVLGRMAGAIAHKIGNPLSSMTARLELVGQQSVSKLVRESVSLLQEQVARIHRLVTNITRFSRSSVMQPVPCDVAAIIDQVFSILRMDRRAQNVVIEADFQDSLPHVYAIRDHLVQVFLNLGLNALEAMPEGGNLTVSLAKSDGRMAIAFTDTGCGMSDEVKSNMFQPFFTTKESGTGLGLFLSYKMVCDMGGIIKDSGAPGAGSRFEVILPVSGSSVGSMPPPRKAERR